MDALKRRPSYPDSRTGSHPVSIKLPARRGFNSRARGEERERGVLLEPNVLDLNFTINFTVRRGRSRSFVKVLQSYCSLTLLCFYRETQWEPVDLNFSRCQRLFMGGFRFRSSDPRVTSATTGSGKALWACRVYGIQP